MLVSTWTWPCGCIPPPITPKASHGLPSCVAKPGISVWKGRLPGAYVLAWFGSRVKSCPRSWNMKPNPGTLMPLPIPR